MRTTGAAGRGCAAQKRKQVIDQTAAAGFYRVIWIPHLMMNDGTRLATPLHTCPGDLHILSRLDAAGSGASSAHPVTRLVSILLFILLLICY